ncbi:RloB family protein [Deminuibacter soli]|uniref:RloB domain-containing protein n=1 Tax=Deminuibacter soli TaxID=2291815 RepID=A0A3E1NIX6_9BACT|nr:RloB family protein [Deminuibacter soli]RFM27774.1 RloB domain-containing protein [Deminuibacter soli]
MARPDKKRKLLRRIAVVGDGVTEKIYFEQLKELERIKDVVIKPELPSKSSKGGSYKKAINTAKSLVEEGYDHVYCLIDFDTVLSENKLADFTQELKSINSNEITVYINNPCFETWVLVHYEKTGKAYADCDTVGKAITKYLKDYCKNQEYLRKKNLYKILRPQLEINAIPNAAFLEDNRAAKGNNYPRAEVYKFFLKEKIVNPKKK